MLKILAHQTDKIIEENIEFNITVSNDTHFGFASMNLLPFLDPKISMHCENCSGLQQYINSIPLSFVSKRVEELINLHELNYEWTVSPAYSKEFSNDS